MKGGILTGNAQSRNKKMGWNAEESMKYEL